MVSSDITSAKESILKTDDIFKFSVFNEPEVKPKKLPRGKYTEPSNEGNLIIHILDIKAPEVHKWLNSLFGIQGIKNINVLISIIGDKVRIKKHKDKEEYILFFRLPSNYRVKYSYNKSIALYQKSVLNRNYQWYNSSKDFIKISKSDSSLGMGEISIRNLEQIILDS